MSPDHRLAEFRHPYAEVVEKRAGDAAATHGAGDGHTLDMGLTVGAEAVDEAGDHLFTRVKHDEVPILLADDQKVVAIALDADLEVSIGDYVLSGGELPAMVLADAVARRVDGVLGDAGSARQDSFEEGLLDCPHYTRPEVYQGQQVPAVLLSGDHQVIRRWRLKQALGRTWLRRPDLLENAELDDEQRQLLDEFRQEHEH